MRLFGIQQEYARRCHTHAMQKHILQIGAILGTLFISPASYWFGLGLGVSASYAAINFGLNLEPLSFFCTVIKYDLLNKQRRQCSVESTYKKDVFRKYICSHNFFAVIGGCFIIWLRMRIFVLEIPRCPDHPG